MSDAITPNPTAGRFAGRYALVTGGGSGIGLACARRLATDGATVTICGRTAEKLTAAAADLAATGAEIRTVAVDVTDEDAVAAAVAAASGPDGELDIAVLSAGTGTLGPVVTTDKAAWDWVLSTNLTGAFLSLKHVARTMAASGGGAIVAISSISGALTHRNMAPYCASKAGLEMLVRTAADELGPARVRVNAVQPSLVATDLTTVLQARPEVLDEYVAATPLPGDITADDVAAAVGFLVSDDSRMITGAILPVDAGITLRQAPSYRQLATDIFGSDAVDRGIVAGI